MGAIYTGATVPVDEAVLILCLHGPKHSKALLRPKFITAVLISQRTTMLANEAVLFLSPHITKISTLVLDSHTR